MILASYCPKSAFILSPSLKTTQNNPYPPPHTKRQRSFHSTEQVANDACGAWEACGVEGKGGGAGMGQDGNGVNGMEWGMGGGGIREVVTGRYWCSVGKLIHSRHNVKKLETHEPSCRIMKLSINEMKITISSKLMLYLCHHLSSISINQLSSSMSTVRPRAGNEI